LTDQRFQVGEFAVGNDKVIPDSDSVAVGVAEDIAAVQNEVSFFESYHQLPTHPPVSSPTSPAQCPPPPRWTLYDRAEGLVGRRKRLRFLDFHLSLATLKPTGAGLVAEDFSATGVTQITFTQYVGHG
jgi:hypothetical protein